jgi:pyridoxal phosphate enzyme (YggS family)
MQMEIKRNIDLIQGEVGRKGCRLIAVSKTHPVEKVKAAYDAGQRIFGENRVQELVPKSEVLPNDIEWHLIGHLQSNKVKYIAPFVSLIHSVDSQKLAEEIDKQGRKINRVIPCLLQIHIASEETKFGFDREELVAFVTGNTIGQLSNIQIRGLMGMATLTDDMNIVQKEFRGLRLLFEQLKGSHLPANVRMEELSMGMSSDYKVAISEGSTLVRIGTAIFGERPHQQ